MQENARRSRPGGVFWVGLGLLCGLVIWRLAGPILGFGEAHMLPDPRAAAPPLSPNGLPYPDLPGVDLSGLSPRQKFTLLHRAAAEHCTCGCKESLAQCRHSDMNCATSLRLSRRLREDVLKNSALAPAH